ncbi:amidohydrolase [Alteribacillus sp. YIM 98480]|uniref:amidohydrolase n=1 Tax=Alteribacillus sp. YIM 98480 TaxID=2606599 RepID=UPI00131E81EF|nr:amidohydrolase [Alteribacillus sp. YIM 98480]
MTGSIADTVLKSNAIFTGVEENPISGAVAIKDNTILTITTTEEIKNCMDSNTKVYDFGNKLIMPGFQDFHIHLFLGGLSEVSVSLLKAKSETEAAHMVKAFADTRPDDEWIFGFRWYHVYWKNKKLPTKHSLDCLLPDRPVFLFNDECHGAWLNSRALELLGINRNTSNPPFGKIEKDEDGEPTGFLFETAMGFAQKAFDQISLTQKINMLERFLQKAARLGITSVSDMLPLPGLELGDLEIYKKFEDEGRLTTRIHFLAALDGDLEKARVLRNRFQSNTLRFSGLKQFLDGVPTTYTALLVEPYSDKQNSYGSTLIPSDLIKKWTIEADKYDFRIRFHACGDGAVRLGLDCFEAAQRENGKRDSRHTIEHVEIIHPEDIDRFATLGVIASMQPEHLAVSENFLDNPYLRRVGKEREAYTFPIKTLLNSGAKLAFGTDYPVVGLEPLDEIYRAITRVHDDGKPDGGWNPTEKITLSEALKAYTTGSAFGTFSEQENGILEAGKLADIIVFDRNLFDSTAEEIKNANVIFTMMNGGIVYENQRVIT